MNDTKNICRLCLKFDRKTISLYNTRSVESVRMNKLVQQVCSIKLEAHEPFPKCICFPCRKKVFNTWEFVNTCKESDKTLRKIYYNNVNKKEENVDSEGTDVKPDEDTKESKMEVEGAENDVVERLQTLRSNTKVAFIASLSMYADLSPNETDQKPLETKQENPKLEQARDEENTEEKTNEEIKNATDEEKLDFVQEKTSSHKEETPNNIPLTDSPGKAKSEQGTEPETEEDENKDIQKVTIKEEFIIPESEDEESHPENPEDFKDPLFNSQLNAEGLEGHFVSVKEELPDTEMKRDFHSEDTLEGNIKVENNEFESSQLESTDCQKMLLKNCTSCPICSRVYDRRGNLYNHMKLQHNITRMQEVPLATRRKEFVVREQISNTSQNTFDLRVSLNEQLENPHALQVQCEHCNATFTTLSAKRRHEQLACTKPYECPFCNTKYKRFKDFRVHMQTHKK